MQVDAPGFDFREVQNIIYNGQQSVARAFNGFDKFALFWTQITIGEQLNETKIVVNKSTVPVGTADKVRDVISKALEERALALAAGVNDRALADLDDKEVPHFLSLAARMIQTLRKGSD